MTVANPSSAAVNGWTVRWTLPNGQTVTQLWNGALTTSGSGVTVRNADYNATIPAGATTSFGFTATSTGPATAPADLTCSSP
ncbi:cellulose binding domain-containing protein [Streptacidiphilus griseoplanus]|uniref:cellulose binding domain-containing protein n=1 Tax=Peterkaempfera griseoplana TaxID=66896 RepID=UPI0006E42A94|nr:cellulose binding domain-containing protein [Peterkaempfera griseoplana]